MAFLSCTLLLGILVQQDRILPSISSVYEESPTVFVGEVIESETIGDSLSISFLITEEFKGIYDTDDIVILFTPQPSFRPGAPADVVPPPESNPTGADAFQAGLKYLVFADSASSIVCCASEGDGYFMLYPHNDYYRTFDLWNNLYQEDILTRINLFQLYYGRAITQPSSYSITALLPGNSETMCFDLRYAQGEYIVESELDAINGLKAFVHYCRRTRNALYCRDANDVQVSIIRDQRLIGSFLGTVENCDLNGINLTMCLINPIVEDLSQYHEYLNTGRYDEPSGFAIQLYRTKTGNRRAVIGDMRIYYDEGLGGVTYNGESAHIVRGSRWLPLAVMPDCRYMVIQISHYGLYDDESDYIVLDLDDISKLFLGDIPYQIYQWCLQYGSISGTAFVVDEQTSKKRRLCYYDITFWENRYSTTE